MKGRRRRQHKVEHWHENSDRRERREKRNRATIERAQDDVAYHASTARPFKANSPRGRFWMNRMMSTRMAILPSTAPA